MKQATFASLSYAAKKKRTNRQRSSIRSRVEHIFLCDETTVWLHQSALPWACEECRPSIYPDRADESVPGATKNDGMKGKICPLTTKMGKTSHKMAENGFFLRNSVPYGQKFGSKWLMAVSVSFVQRFLK